MFIRLSIEMNTVMKYLKKLKIMMSSRKNKDLNIIHSIEDFQRIFKRECARADRSNKMFTFMVFKVDNQNEDDSFADFLTTFLSSRVRFSDEVGWINEKDIGVLLPDTSPEGAWKLAEEIRQKMSLTISSPSCMVYTYPSSQHPLKFD